MLRFLHLYFSAVDRAKLSWEEGNYRIHVGLNMRNMCQVLQSMHKEWENKIRREEDMK